MAKKITLTETEIPDATDRDVLACWLSAKRAQRQAEAIIDKLALRILKLARTHPGLLFDGARITVGRNTQYTYSPNTVRQMGDLAALQAEERETRRAIAATTEHTQLHELAKFAGQPLVTPARTGIFKALFGKA
ncbi:MAG: hypothetical protein V4726_11125 [Verrucomicrobiota bacterium]